MITFTPISIFLILVILYVFISNYLPLSTIKNIQDPYHDNIEKHTLSNNNYRKVLYTTSNLQLVLMSLAPKEEIGLEMHPKTSQFIRVEKGSGVAIINGKNYPLEDGNVVVIPPRAEHNIINLSNYEPLKLYSIYTPPNHPINTLQATKPNNEH